MILNLSTTDIWAWIILCCGGAVLYIAGCLGATLTFTHQTLVEPSPPAPSHNHHKCLQNLPVYCPLCLYGFYCSGYFEPMDSWHMAFCDWLISLCIRFSRLIVLQHTLVPHLCPLSNNIPWWRNTFYLFIRELTDIWVVFQFVAIMILCAFT